MGEMFTSIGAINSLDQIDQLRKRIDELERLLKAVQSDPGVWLHPDLDQAIEDAVGPAEEYRSVDDSGITRCNPI